MLEISGSGMSLSMVPFRMAATKSSIQRGKVAVLGLGVTGLGTLKNLLEDGFDAVGFERNSYVGGLWHYSEDPTQTTVLKRTKANNSKQRNCYQDFPYPEHVPDYPSGDNVATYLRDYVERFNFGDRCRLGIRVDHLEILPDSSQWLLTLRNQEKQWTETFDRVVVTTGTFSAKYMPQFEGQESFTGDILHAQEIKDANAFKNKRVIMVGLGNTAGDIAVDLSEAGSEVFVSVRSKPFIISRPTKGKPLDHKATRRLSSIGVTMNAKFPNTLDRIGRYFLSRSMLKEYPSIKPLLNGLPERPLYNSPPTVNDHFNSLLATGKLSLLPALKRFNKDSAAFEFENGTVIKDVHAIIFCTGYYSDFSILGPDADPTKFPAPEWTAMQHMNGLEYPRLYQGIFSTKYHDSLAFIGPFRGHSLSACANADLSSQAIAQIWKGNAQLPSEQEMEAWCDANYAECLAFIAKWRISKVATDPRQLERWLNDAAGNGMNDMFGWTSWKAWKFWWHNPRLYHLIMDGIDTPFVYRLFEGRGPTGRRKWEGAREAIFVANQRKGKKAS